jgi:hypothetical protein
MLVIGDFIAARSIETGKITALSLTSPILA